MTRKPMDTVLSKLLKSHSYWSCFVPSFYYPYSIKGGRVYLDISESSMMFARVIGQYEVEKQKALETFLPQGGTFIDIGSNKGDFTVLAAQLAGGKGRVLSVEPEPTNYKWLLKTIRLNKYKNITPFEIALSDSEGTQKLKKGEKTGFHSLLSKDDSSSTVDAVEVRVRTLGGLLEEIGWNRAVDVVKIDVEGAEMKVLKGATYTLTQNKNITLLIDIHPSKVDTSQLFKFLEELGFGLFQEQPPFTIPVDEEQTTPRSVVARRV